MSEYARYMSSLCQKICQPECQNTYPKMQGRMSDIEAEIMTGRVSEDVLRKMYHVSSGVSHNVR